ncbi:RrF2 family transcriptional regulator [Peredibacter starrii]|uniref:Rrf2 family transcriptional regulator n=1 Tax=Peredibacter starrii TaxID=28202 RepID=A0AAX4HQ50_9BACT|nr:Rrf2 family transcriptional regulator [Peredibacter starrii]WPU65064.1 Rrf2 family transcriptional regulator [Peredibacter starrii]
MILGNQVEWALHCMSVLSRMPDDVIVPAALLAEFHGVPKEYLSKALQQLANEGILITSRGAKGGYKLGRSPKMINLLQIVEAIEGRKSTFNCQEIRLNNPCGVKEKKSRLPICSIAAVMYEADDAWREVLVSKKLSDINRDVESKVSKEVLKQSIEWFLERI